MPRWVLIIAGFAILGVVVFGVMFLGQRFAQNPPPDSAPDTSTPQTPLGITIEAQINKSATALGVGILPLSIVEDSRCPIGAECVWAGTVRLKTRIHSALGDSDMVLTLGTPVTTEAETITLVEVVPANRAGVRIAPGDYHFVFTIAKRTE